MSDLAFVALAYGIIWLALFGYVFSLNQRERELRRDISVITNVLREREIPIDPALGEVPHAPEPQPLEVKAPSPAR